MVEKSVASSKSGSKQNYMTQEKTGFEKFSADLKDSVFQVLYLILKEEDDSLISLLVSVGFDWMQMGAFAFSDSISSIWKAEEFLQFVFDVFSFFQLGTYFESAFTYTNFLVSFYLFISVIVLMIVNIIYVSYAFSKKRVTAIWTVMILRSFTSLVFTVFFLPVTELMISMIECEYNDDGNFVLSMFPGVICFQGSHLVHATVSILVTIVFSIIGFIVALAYFEIRMITEDITARQNSRGDVLFILNKIILQISFSFLSSNAQWWLVGILIIGAIALWYVYNIKEPYYRKEPSILFKVLTTYYLWTCSLVFFSKLLETTSFTGGLIAWFIGLPFIGAIILSSTKSRITSLVQTTSRFKTSQHLMDHLRFVLQLIDIHKTDKNANILLTGYVEKHKDTCDEEDCPLKVKRKKRASVSSEMDEMTLGLILVCDRMYQTGIKKFKNSAKLRINYAMFLLERMKKTKKAEMELTKAKELNPGFEDQFIIFRLTKLISDGLEGVDVVGLIAWENYKNLYQDYVKESVNLHKEFWLELREDKPNLHKLNYLGSKVNNAMSYAREYWLRLQKIRQDDPVVLRTYGRFLIDIQHEIVEGHDLIQKAKKLMTKKNYHQFAKRNSFDAGLDHLPYVEVVGSGQEMGKIKKANLLFTVLVGLNRDEILEKKINLFMPDLFSQYHDSFLKRYNLREDDDDIEYLDNENKYFVRTRSGYINPVIVRVSRLRTEETSNQIVFGAWFKAETAKRTYVHLICSKDGTITDMSASAVTVLNLSFQNVKKTKMNIDKIVPNALTDKTYRESGKEIIYKINDVTNVYFIAQVSPILLKDSKNRDFLELYASLNPGNPITVNDPSYGYIIKLDKLEKAVDINTAANGSESGKLTERRKKKDLSTPGLERDNSMRTEPSRASKLADESPQKKDNDGQIIYGFQTDYAELEISELFQNDGGIKFDLDKLVKQEEEVQKERINYGEGITLKKYLDGRLVEVREDDDEPRQPIEDDDDEDSLFRRKDDEELEGLMTKKRKDKLSALKRLVKDALEVNSKNLAIATIRGLTFIWVVSIFVIAIVEFALLSNIFGDYQSKIHVTELFVDKLTQITIINSYITDLITYNTDPNVLPIVNASQEIEERRLGIKTSVTKIVQLTRELEEGHLFQFIEPFIVDDIHLIVHGELENEHLLMNETEAVLFVSSRAYNLASLPLENFTSSNYEVLTVLSNYYNQILPTLRLSTIELQNDFVKKLNTFEYEFILLISLNLLIALLTSLWAMLLLVGVDQQKEDILFLFLEIPPGNVDSISRKGDKFMDFFETVVRQLQNNQDADHENSTDSDVSFEDKRNGGKETVFDESLKDGALKSRDPGSQEEEEEALKNRKKLIKKYKSKKFGMAKSSIIKVFIITAISLVYSISSLISILVSKSELSNYSEQYFTSNLLSDSILSTINMNRMMRLDNMTFPIEGKPALQAGLDSLTELNNLGNNLGDFFLYVIYKNNALENEVTTLFFGNACEFINETIRPDCETSLSQALKLGIFNLKEQVFKLLMEKYNAFITSSYTSSTTEYIELLNLNDDFKDYTLKILDQFNLNEEKYLKAILNDAVSLQEIILIVYLIIIIGLILLFWLPYVSRMNAEIWRTTRMINMIPLEIVNNIPSIKRFLKYLIRRMN